MVFAKAEGNGGESDILENGVETQGDRAEPQGPRPCSVGTRTNDQPRMPSPLHAPYMHRGDPAWSGPSSRL